MSFSGGTPSVGNSKYYNGEIPFIRSAEINSAITELYLTEEGLKNSSAKMVNVGDILYALYGATSGEVGISKINGAINQAILAIKPYDAYNSKFIEQWLKNQKKNIIDKYLQGGQGNLSAAIVKKLLIPFPSLPEQKAIGDFFQTLDRSIALHQRELENLKNRKKSLLQKMFPKNGESVPKIRFSEFKNAPAWDQRKLGEVGITQSGIGFPDAEQGGKEGIPFFKVSDMNIIGNEFEMQSANNYVSKEQIERKNWKPITSVPAIMFAKVGAAIMLNRKRLIRHPFLIDNNTMAYIFDKTWDINFGKIIFDTIYLPKYSQVGALPSYNGSDIENINVFMPNSLPEQKAIGDFFSTLDRSIALHQRKLEHLKLRKKALLQKMFP